MAPDDTPSLPRPFFDSVPALSIDLSANCSLIVVLHAGSARNNGGFAVPHSWAVMVPQTAEERDIGVARSAQVRAKEFRRA